MVVFWCLFVCFFKVVGLGGGGGCNSSPFTLLV